MIEIHDAGSLLPPDGEDLLRRAAQTVLEGEGIFEAELSLAVVDDPEMHRLNREYLQHDYPTDVLTFRLDDEAEDSFGPKDLRAAAIRGDSDDASSDDDGDYVHDSDDAEDFDDEEEDDAYEDDDDFDDDDDDLPEREAPPEVGLEGEVIVSFDYASAEAARRGWSAMEELTLYVVHGCLHLAGFDDLTPEAAALMRAAERKYLFELGLPTDKVGTPLDKVAPAAEADDASAAASDSASPDSASPRRPSGGGGS